MSESSPIPISSYKDCFKVLLCETPSEDCYFGKYNKCPNSHGLQELLEDIFEQNSIEYISLDQWISTPRTTMERFQKDTDDFIEYFCVKLRDLLPHAFIAMHQSSFSRELKLNLKDGEFQVIVDFAENYAFTVQDAVPGFHWNNDQATVYNIVIYYKEDGTVKHTSLVIISDCLTHDTVAVYTFQKILLNFLKNKFALVSKIIYFSDGAPQQYKNYKNVINLAYHKKDFSVEAEWHFYATAHGKGPCDGLGATVKRAAVRASLQLTNNKNILTCKDLYEWLKSTSRLPNIEFRFSPVSDYNVSKRSLNQRFKLNARIERLQEQHCLVPIQNGTIRSRMYSRSLTFKDTKIF